MGTLHTFIQHIHRINKMNSKVLLVLAAVAVLFSDAGVVRREKRSLGLVQAGALGAAKAAGAAALSVAKVGALGAGVVAAKPLALGLLGKYAIYKWLKSGSNAGVTGHVGLGPFKVAGAQGFDAPVETPFVAPAESTDGDYW